MECEPVGQLMTSRGAAGSRCHRRLHTHTRTRSQSVVGTSVAGAHIAAAIVGDSAVPLLPKLRPELVFLRGEDVSRSRCLCTMPHTAAR